MTMQNLTIHSDKQEQFQSSSVHEPKCNICNHKYTGQATRWFTDRFEEHINNTGNSKKSNYTKHILKRGHEYGNT
jgi:hypothetical protein